jgi:hypothetical protein
MGFLSNFFSSNKDPESPWNDQRALIKWNNSEPWTIADSFEGVQVFGDTGSGKSSDQRKGCWRPACSAPVTAAWC